MNSQHFARAEKYDSEASAPKEPYPLAPWTHTERSSAQRPLAGKRLVEDVDLKGRRAVIVDDDPAVVWFLAGLLREAGVQVHEAHDGQQALTMVFETWPDFVISDILMPKLDGFGLCRTMKRDVAVRDVPVILLSWKEDLLQRMRELGAGADGYLRKEATASTVIRRVQEVMCPRARVEARLAAGGGVRGRLDGLTPRLVLELAAKHRGNCRVSVRDAVYLYEVEFRQGKPQQATRTSSDGSFERGAKVLSGLLGVSAGRFVVTRSEGKCRDEFRLELGELIQRPIQRARAALMHLSGRGLAQVDRVEIDEAAVSAYIASTPGSARALIKRLAQGDSPRVLVRDGLADPLFMSSILGDIAAHGGIKNVFVRGQPIDLDDEVRFHFEDATSDDEVEDSAKFTFGFSSQAPEVSGSPPGAVPLTLNSPTPDAVEEALAGEFPRELNTLPGLAPAPQQDDAEADSPKAPLFGTESTLVSDTSAIEAIESDADGFAQAIAQDSPEPPTGTEAHQPHLPPAKAIVFPPPQNPKNELTRQRASKRPSPRRGNYRGPKESFSRKPSNSTRAPARTTTLRATKNLPPARRKHQTRTQRVSWTQLPTSNPTQTRLPSHLQLRKAPLCRQLSPSAFQRLPKKRPALNPRHRKRKAKPKSKAEKATVASVVIG